jgi:hypothetical protein
LEAWELLASQPGHCPIVQVFPKGESYCECGIVSISINNPVKLGGTTM